ncbi:MAG: phosphodiesterase, partial [Bacillota bacterium]
MRQVKVTDAVGAKVARAVYAADGRALVKEGVVLTEGVVEGLARRGYEWVIVQDGLLEDVVIDDVLCEETRVEATAAVSQALQKVLTGG